jgi:hypothetical protein
MTARVHPIVGFCSDCDGKQISVRRVGPRRDCQEWEYHCIYSEGYRQIVSGAARPEWCPKANGKDDTPK